MSISRRRILKNTGGGLAGILASGVAPYHFVRNIAKAAEGDTIKVGILHSLSGTIAIIESSLHNAELLAIEEINAKGGVLGKKIQPVVEDPQSMVQVFAEKAKNFYLRKKLLPYSGAIHPPAANRCSQFLRRTTACCSTRHSTKPKNAARTASTPAPFLISNSMISCRDHQHPRAQEILSDWGKLYLSQGNKPRS